MAAAFPLAEAAPSGHAVGACCAAHPGGTCPDHYSQSLEPHDETIAELQSVVVAMRHRRDSNDVFMLEELLELHLGRVLTSRAERTSRADLISNLMALAAVAIRYREEL